jgi:hypothetical protein
MHHQDVPTRRAGYRGFRRGSNATPEATAKTLNPTPNEASQTGQPPAQAANAQALGGDWTKALIKLPDRVLVGTDVVPLAGFLSQATPIPVTGTFQSEQGGAAAEIRLEAGPKGPAITRQLAEPGTAAQVKRYESLSNHAQGVRLSGEDVEVLGTANSILVLEKRSGVDGIPDSLWILYERKPFEAPVKGN